MTAPNPYEKSRFADRMKEIGILCLFITGSALLATFIMDLLVYPVAIFAVNNKTLYTFMVRNISLALLLLVISVFIIRRVVMLRREGYGTAGILSRIARRMVSATVWLFICMGITGTVIAVIYFLLSYNYYLLYKLT